MTIRLFAPVDWNLRQHRAASLAQMSLEKPIESAWFAGQKKNSPEDSNHCAFHEENASLSSRGAVAVQLDELRAVFDQLSNEQQQHIPAVA